MRILFLSDNFPPESNAPARRVHEHAAAWVEGGHQVTVITCAPNFPRGEVFAGYRNRWYARETVDGIDVVRVKTYITANEGLWRRSLDYISFMFAGVAGGLVQAPPDVIVGTTPQFFTAVGTWLLSVLRRRPLVLEVRDLWPASIVAVGALQPGRTVRMLERLELFLYRRATLIVSATESFKRDMVGRGITADKIHVVRAGADGEQFYPRAKDRELVRELGLEGKFVAGYVGTHGLAHALESVIDAAERLRGNPQIAFLLAGGGARLETLRERVDSTGLDNVLIIGPQSTDMAPRIWSVCDLALVPLRDDPLFRTVLPTKMIEAMAMGLPILISVPEGEATEIVREHGLGEIVPPCDPEQLATAIVGLHTDAQRLATYAAASVSAARHFTRDLQAARMLAVLTEAAAR